MTVARAPVHSRCFRITLAGPIVLGLVATPASAQLEVRNGDPHDGKLTWYTPIGMAVRDTLREGSGKCDAPAGEIVICKKRENFRIDPGVLRASRLARSSGGDEYDAYRQSRGH